jgi:hypothetical protein
MSERRYFSWDTQVPVKLLKEIQKEHDRGASYELIARRLAAAGYSVSRSSVGRWSQRRRSELAAVKDPAEILGAALVKLIVDNGFYIGVRK